MRIAVLTSGILPIPSVKGGAVENLTDFYLSYNHVHKLHDITVYSTYCSDIEKHTALQSDVNHYVYINVNSLKAKIMKRLYKWMHRDGYYFYTIEYFIDQVIPLLRKGEYNVILIENRPGFILKLKGFSDARIIYHLHNAKLDETVPQYQRIYDRASLIITVSEFVAKGIRTINPHDEKTVVVYNGIDLSAFRPNICSSLNRPRIHFGDKDFVMAYNGKINPEKGIMELILAMKLLKDYPQIKLLAMGSTFYGDNSYNDHPYAHKLLREAEQVRDRITFTSFIPYQDMPDYLSLCDIAIIPSVWDEPFGLSIVEAMAMGLPVITTRRGGIQEVVTEENAILLDTDEHFVENLATAILDLYKHPEKRTAMSKASLERSKRFDKETYAKNFFKAIESIT